MTPEIAVHRLGGMQEERRRAGAGQRRRDLAADDARLAHAGDDDAAAARRARSRRRARSGDRASRRRPRIAAASISSTLRASARPRSAAARWRTADGHGFLTARRRLRLRPEPAAVGRTTPSSATRRVRMALRRSSRSAFCAVALRARRIFVDFHEHAVDAGGDARPTPAAR